MSWSIFRGVTGHPEWTRVFGSAGVAIYIVGVHVYESYTVFWTDRGFDLVAYCAAFPTGLGLAIAAVAGSSALKDRQIAVAQTIQATGNLPASAPAAPVPPPPTGPAMPEPAP